MVQLDLLLNKVYTLESDDNNIYSSISRPIVFFDIKPPLVLSAKFMYAKYDKFENTAGNNYINETKWDKETESYIVDSNNQPNMKVSISVYPKSTKYKNVLLPSVVESDELEGKISKNLQDVSHIETNDYFQYSYILKNKSFDKFTYINDVKNYDIYSYVNSEENGLDDVPSGFFDFGDGGSIDFGFIHENKQNEDLQQNVYYVSVSKQLRYVAFKNVYSLSFNTNNKKRVINDFIVGGMNRFNADSSLARNSFFVELDSDWYLSSEDFTFSSYQMTKLEPAAVPGLLNQIVLSGDENFFNSIKTTTGTSANLVGYVIRRSESEGGEFVMIGIVIGDLSGETIFYPSNLEDYSISYGDDYIYSVTSLVELQQAYYGEDGSLNFGTTYISGAPSKLLYVSAVDFLPPSSPKDFNILFKGTTAVLNWALPNDTEGKIRKFNIYKRSNTEQSFSLIMQYDFRDWKGVYGETTSGFEKYGHNSNVRTPSVFKQTKDPVFSHEDNLFSFGDIYAITSVDAHENESNYSQQLVVEQSPGSYNVKPSTRMLSIAGAPLAYPNWFLYDELVDSISNHIKFDMAKEVRVYFDPDARKIAGVKSGVVDDFTSGENKYLMNFVNTDLMEERNVELRIANQKKKL